MKVVLVQLNGQPDKAHNLATIERLVDAACAAERPDWVFLPEMVTSIGGDRATRLAAAETFPDGAVYRLLQDLARRHGVLLHGGSLLEQGPAGKCYNTTVVFDEEGQDLGRYRKLHLFDIETPSGRVFKESDAFAAGCEVVTLSSVTPPLGLSICYDLRFPELYQALMRQGAEVIAVPSAFTLETGRDHWEVLLRARAIETASWVVAAAQWGGHGPTGRTSYGHSLVVDPWGHVVARHGDGEGWCAARIDPAKTERVRRQIPVHRHKVL
ncbi:MAG: carbon-nitrogen hydrolase family protein [Geminicoccaceae bacterium]|nr:MAG: carbon-nitrogen hydrolase family protein [Geminicoccaceae bacterium]